MTKAERTRQFIIEQSAPLFNTKGVAGTAMSDIMEATKMAKGGLYGHFDSKEDLSHAVVDYCLNTVAEKMACVLNQQKTAQGKLFAYIDFHMEPTVAGGCPMANFGMEADDTNPVINQKIKTSINRSVKTITDIINSGIEAGEFKDNINAQDFALKIFAMLEGGVMMTRVAGTNNQMGTIIKLLKTEIEEKLM